MRAVTSSGRPAVGPFGACCVPTDCGERSEDRPPTSRTSATSKNFLFPHHPPPTARSIGTPTLTSKPLDATFSTLETTSNPLETFSSPLIALFKPREAISSTCTTTFDPLETPTKPLGWTLNPQGHKAPRKRALHASRIRDILMGSDLPTTPTRPRPPCERKPSGNHAPYGRVRRRSCVSDLRVE